MNKKAQAEDTLGSDINRIGRLVWVAIFIVILVVAGVSVYNGLTINQKKQAATSTLNSITKVIDVLQTPDSSLYEKSIVISRPKNGMILGFVNGDIMPADCDPKTGCLCVCEKYFNKDNLIEQYDSKGAGQILKCNEMGSCKTVDNLNSFDPIEIGVSYFDLNIKLEKEKIILSKVIQDG